jgi:hypothetical protein
VSTVADSRMASPARPGTLTAAIGLAVITALSAIVNGVIILTGGADLVRELGNELLATELGVSEAEVAEAADFAGPVIDQLYEEATSTYQTRAYLLLVFGAAVLVFGLLMRKAGTTFRVLVCVSTALLIVFATVVAVDAATTAMIGLALAAIVGSIATFVTTLLPANGRYAKAVKAGQ